MCALISLGFGGIPVFAVQSCRDHNKNTTQILHHIRVDQVEVLLFFVVA